MDSSFFYPGYCIVLRHPPSVASAAAVLYKLARVRKGAGTVTFPSCDYSEYMYVCLSRCMCAVYRFACPLTLLQLAFHVGISCYQPTAVR